MFRIRGILFSEMWTAEYPGIGINRTSERSDGLISNGITTSIILFIAHHSPCLRAGGLPEFNLVLLPRTPDILRDFWLIAVTVK